MDRRHARPPLRPFLWIALVLATALVLGTNALGDSPATVQPADLAALVGVDDGPLLLDVRTAEEFADGHVPGALLIPVQELEDRLGQIAAYKERGVVAYCERGGRARKALEILEAAGFTNLKLLDGSMQRYRREMTTE